MDVLLVRGNTEKRLRRWLLPGENTQDALVRVLDAAEGKLRDGFGRAIVTVTDNRGTYDIRRTRCVSCNRVRPINKVTEDHICNSCEVL